MNNPIPPLTSIKREDMYNPSSIKKLPKINVSIPDTVFKCISKPVNVPTSKTCTHPRKYNCDYTNPEDIDNYVVYRQGNTSLLDCMGGTKVPRSDVRGGFVDRDLDALGAIFDEED